MQHTPEITHILKLIADARDLKRDIQKFTAKWSQFYFGIISPFKIIDIDRNTFLYFLDFAIQYEDKPITRPVVRVKNGVITLEIGEQLNTQIYLQHPYDESLIKLCLEKGILKF
ncbi:MAG: hypothetical protein ACK5OS_02045 [Chryseotalea sp.]